MLATSQYEFLACLLLAILVLAFAARRLRLPPAAAFISGGLALALTPGVPPLEIDPDLVLLVFLPPLIMNGAYFTAWREFRENLTGIMLLALGAVAFTTAVVGVALKSLQPALPWAACFALGAIVSPPDAVAAEAVLQRIKLPRAMSALLEGESLVNDASGIVLYRFAVAATLTGAFSIRDALSTFFTVVIGGLLVGAGLGWLGLKVLRRLNDSDLAISATLVLAIASYVVADRLHLSGVLSTVSTGMLLGWHQHELLPATIRVRGQAFWGVLVFILESLLFVLIGLSLRGVLTRLRYAGNLQSDVVLPVLAVLAAVMVSRFIWLYASVFVRTWAGGVGLPKTGRPSRGMVFIVGWAGMRGVVTLAAALALPTSFPGRDLILVCAFAVIVVTVLVQGTTLGPLIRLLGLGRPEKLLLARRRQNYARMQVTQAQHEAIASLSGQLDGTQLHPRLLEQMAHRARIAEQHHLEPEGQLATKTEHFQAILASVVAARSEALRLHRAGEIDDGVLRNIECELDLQQMAAEAQLE